MIMATECACVGPGAYLWSTRVCLLSPQQHLCMPHLSQFKDSFNYTATKATSRWCFPDPIFF